MRINQAKLPQDNLLGEIRLPFCPSLFKVQAENILVLLGKIPSFTYHSMGQFDKRLIAEYWRYSDGFDRVLSQTGRINTWGIFISWFDGATNPEYIRRARQWLVEHDYLIPNLPSKEKARDNAEKARVSVKGEG